MKKRIRLLLTALFLLIPVMCTATDTDHDPGAVEDAVIRAAGARTESGVCYVDIELQCFQDETEVLFFPFADATLIESEDALVTDRRSHDICPELYAGIIMNNGDRRSFTLAFDMAYQYDSDYPASLAAALIYYPLQWDTGGCEQRDPITLTAEGTADMQINGMFVIMDKACQDEIMLYLISSIDDPEAVLNNRPVFCPLTVNVIPE
ncbi:MAG: hypothetical protein Q4G19_01620 [Clostridia bacterium]|nr:hypothetical protein [Clostridia bacterium]